jgi:hypothetical protein
MRYEVISIFSSESNLAEEDTKKICEERIAKLRWSFFIKRYG